MNSLASPRMVVEGRAGRGGCSGRGAPMLVSIVVEDREAQREEPDREREDVTRNRTMAIHLTRRDTGAVL